jgi:hypothetical protein
MGAFLSTFRVLSETEVNTVIRHLSSIDGIDPPISDKQCQDIRMIIEKGNPGHVLTLLKKCYFKIGTQQRTDSFNKIISEGSSSHNFELLTVWARHSVLSAEWEKRLKLLKLLKHGQSKEHDPGLPKLPEHDLLEEHSPELPEHGQSEEHDPKLPEHDLSEKHALELPEHGLSKEHDPKLPDALELSDELFAAAVKRVSHLERIEFLRGYCRELSLPRLEIFLGRMGFGFADCRELLKELGRGDALASMDEDYDRSVLGWHG